MIRVRRLLPSLFAVLLGCAGPSGEEAETQIGELSTVPADGTVEAWAMLAAVNASDGFLPGLTGPQVQSLREARAGADRTNGTEDDPLITSLRVLRSLLLSGDSLPVAEEAANAGLEAIRDYSTQQGLVETVRASGPPWRTLASYAPDELDAAIAVASRLHWAALDTFNAGAPPSTGPEIHWLSHRAPDSAPLSVKVIHAEAPMFLQYLARWTKDVGIRDIQGSADDPFASASCPGAPLDAAALASMTASGARSLGSYQYAVRTRECTKLTGCAGWQTTDSVQEGHAELFMTEHGPSLRSLDDDDAGTFETGVSNGVFVRSTMITSMPNVVLFGKLTEHCFRAVQTTEVRTPIRGRTSTAWHEYQFVWLGQF